MIGVERGVSTVADVTLAVFLVGAAMALLVGFVGSEQVTHEPTETEYTTETVLSSTTNTTYYVERAIADSYGVSDIEIVYEETDHERADLRRVSHGPIVAQLADAAVANVAFENEVFSARRLTWEGHEFRQRLDQKLQSRLVGSSFETHVTAVWTPFEDSSWVRGTAELGPKPPKYEDVSSTTVTVSSDIPAVREQALDAVDEPDDFDVVAEIVATAVVEGYLPELAAQRSLEDPGIERALVVARYRNMAAILDPEPAVLNPGEAVEDHLGSNTANATRANDILIAALAAQFEQLLEPDPSKPPAEQPLGNATEAAKQIATGEVTVTVRTWD